MEQRSCEKQTIEECRILESCHQANESTHAVADQKEGKPRLLLPLLLARLHHRPDVVVHPLRLGPAARTRAVPDVIVAPAEESTSSTCFAETVVVRGEVLSIAMADEHESLGFLTAVPLQRVRWPGVGGQRF